MIRLIGLSLAALVATGGGVRAEPLVPPSAPALKTPVLTTPLKLKPVGPIELGYAQAPAPLPRGVARTAIERREGAVSAGLGVLCGIHPSADDSGPGRARGYNTEGRFVGAKLGFSF